MKSQGRGKPNIPDQNQKLSHGEIANILSDKDSDRNNTEDTVYEHHSPIASVQDIEHTTIEHGNGGVMVTHRHKPKPHKDNEPYQSPHEQKHMFTNHQQFAAHFRPFFKDDTDGGAGGGGR